MLLEMVSVEGTSYLCEGRDLQLSLPSAIS